MKETINMWNILSKMGSVESKLKAGYHTHAFTSFIGSVGHLGPIDSDKQFPCFKPNPSILCRQNYNKMNTEPTNSSPQTHETKNNSQQCNNSNKKKRRRRRRKKKKSKNCQNVKVKTVPERQRHQSTTSEDSFIMFDENCEDNCLISDISDDETETIEDVYSSDSTVTQKKVRFADELCEVHSMVKWAYAYQAARKGPWEEYARDRDRFHKRVISIEADIGHVFNSKHRTKIYNERFQT